MDSSLSLKASPIKHAVSVKPPEFRVYCGRVARAARFALCVVSYLTCTGGMWPAHATPVGGPGPAKPQHPGYETDANWQVGFTATLASDYVNRGVSQTSEDPQFSAGLETSYRGGYAGVTAFHVNFRNMGNRMTDSEVDIYGGYVVQIAGQVFDFGVIRYSYTPAPFDAGLNYTEYYAKTARQVGPVSVALSVYYSADGMAHAGTSWYSVGSGNWQLDQRWSLSALVGRQVMQAGGNYDDANIGTTYQVMRSLAFDLRYWNTDRHRLGRDYREHVVASMNWSFP